MKLNFNFQIKALNGKEIEGDNGKANVLLSNVLASLNKGNSIKLYDWAFKLYNGKHLEIDDTDGEVLRELVEKSEFLTVLAKKPIIDVIEAGLKGK